MKADSGVNQQPMVQGYSAGLGSMNETRMQAGFGQDGYRTTMRQPSLQKQVKPKGLIYDDYSNGEISLIIDEDL